MQIGSSDPADLKLIVPKKSGPSMSWIALVASLVATNVATGALAVFFYLTPAPAYQPSSLSQAVFSAQHSMITNDQPRSRAQPNISYARMQRTELSYRNHPMGSYIIAAGQNTIYDADGTATHEVHTEVVNGSTFGEFTQAHGRVGTKTLQMRFVDLSSGAEAILIPMSLSVRRGGPTLVPNLYFFSHRAHQSAQPSATFLSTVAGSFAFQNESMSAEWDATMTPAFQAYANAWLSTHGAAASASRRRLGFGSFMAGKVGGMFGSDASGGSSLGGAIGSAAGRIGAGMAYGDETAGDAASTMGWSAAGYAATKLGGSSGGTALHAAEDLYNGDSVGETAGSIAGGEVGSDVGKAVGADVGGAAGAALGSAVGGPVGGVVGEEAGSWAGGLAGGYVGGKVGSELGGDVGEDVENDAESAWDDASSDAESAWDSW